MKIKIWPCVLVIAITNVVIYSQANQENISFIEVKNSHGYLSHEFLKKMHELFRADIFIETGTFLGNSTREAAKIFKNVHTIEKDTDLFNDAIISCSEFKNITLHEGDSADVFKDLLRKVKGKLIFWLDGHYSGIHDGHPTAMTDNDILLKELQLIKDCGHDTSIIMIDDIRLCDDCVMHLNDPIIGGYPHISNIVSKLLEINPHYLFLIIGDVLIAYPDKENVKPSIILQSCKYSRLFDGNNYDDNFIIDLEKNISFAKSGEKKSIEILSNTFGSDWHAISYGLGRHYILWHSLILLNNNDFEKAYYKLSHIKALGYDHWRIDWYLAQAAYGMGEIDEMELLLSGISNNISNLSVNQIILKDKSFFNYVKK
jgi:hypothetical protein